MYEASKLAPLKAKITEIWGEDFQVNDDLLNSVSIVNLAQGQVLFIQGELFSCLHYRSATTVSQFTEINIDPHMICVRLKSR